MDITTVLEELKAREPIFHHPEFGVTREQLEQQTAEDFWEIGASGRRYDRDVVINTVVERFTKHTEPDTSGWHTREFAIRELGSDTYALTYVLDQDGRVTRRLTLWQNTTDGWKILYHQGTIVSGA